jgi:hypothetical protein
VRLTTDGTDITDPNFATKSTKHTELGDPQIETRSAPALLGATHRAFTFYLGNPFPRLKLACFPTRSPPPRGFTFYLAGPISSIAQISAD